MITRGAVALKEAGVYGSLRRHEDRDWGDVGEEDKEANDTAVREGHRLVRVNQVLRDHRSD